MMSKIDRKNYFDEDLKEKAFLILDIIIAAIVYLFQVGLMEEIYIYYNDNEILHNVLDTWGYVPWPMIFLIGFNMIFYIKDEITTSKQMKMQLKGKQIRTVSDESDIDNA